MISGAVFGAAAASDWTCASMIALKRDQMSTCAQASANPRAREAGGGAEADPVRQERGRQGGAQEPEADARAAGGG